MKQSKSLIAALNSAALVHHQPNQTWIDGLTPILEEAWRSRDVARRTDSEIEDALWARVSPETIQQATPETQQALERLMQELRECQNPEDELCKDHVRKRISTLTMSNPETPVLVADVVRRGQQTLRDALEQVEEALLDYNYANQPMRPTFDMDQLGLIAECVQSYSGGKITSDGKEFYFDGAPIPKPAIESFIEATLASIELLHPVHRRRVPANRKMLVEVLAKIATKYYRQPSTSTKYLRTVHSAENFLNENVLLDSTRWTASADIYGAYLHWCEARNALPLDEPVFFKALSRWGVESVARVKSRAAGRAPGYRGIVLRL